MPMGAGRDGINLGEGAAIFLMEKNRGEIALLGVGESSDAYHLTAPEPEGKGAEASMRAALADAGLIILTAGAAQRVGETRMDLLRRNAAIFEEILKNVCRYNHDAILLVVTNPVDVLTELTRRFSGFPAHRVLGSGTVLDTARLKFLLGERLAVDPRQVHAFIIGEHGDSELPVFSSANISGVDLQHFTGGLDVESNTLQALFEQARDAAYRIIRAKGSTYYAIAEAVRRIVTAILRDEHALLPVSVHTGGAYGIPDLTLSLPAILGAEGVLRIPEISLSFAEQHALECCATRIREALDSILLPQ
jgi:L-lactate dehydrogenase